MPDPMVVCRFVHFAAVLLMFGASAFRCLLPGRAVSRAVDQALLTVCRVLACVALASAVCWLLLTTQAMAGSWSDTLQPSTLWLVLGSTIFGQVWAAHLLFSGLLVTAMYARVQLRTRCLLGFLLLITLAPVGHGAMLDGWQGQLLMLNQAIHLTGVGAWLGGLLVLWLVLKHPGEVNVQRLLWRFSQMGGVLVAAIVFTGLVNTRVLTGQFWPTPLFNGFALILLIKVLVVVAMLGLALFNLLMSRAGHTRVLRRSVLVEGLLGLAGVAAVSLLGTLPPLVI